MTQCDKPDMPALPCCVLVRPLPEPDKPGNWDSVVCRWTELRTCTDCTADALIVGHSVQSGAIYWTYGPDREEWTIHSAYSWPQPCTHTRTRSSSATACAVPSSVPIFSPGLDSTQPP